MSVLVSTFMTQFAAHFPFRMCRCVFIHTSLMTHTMQCLILASRNALPYTYCTQCFSYNTLECNTHHNLTNTHVCCR
eukprot:m.352275 g.352275  ORF g.352275 m.352275 type:complete len:77 (+) comp16481_c0_seq1:1408-1638(+)